ncbi:MAG: AAA family ATPase [Ktedonobacteraceae bacterium]
MGNEVAVHLTVRLLGTPDARISGVPLVLHHQKARAILYYLAATGRPHTRDHLATLLWSESPESNARHSLRSSLYHLRQALHAKGADEALAGDGDQVYLKLDDDACDIAHFRRLLAEGSESALFEAISLYRGQLLQGFTLTDAPLFEEWVRFEEMDSRQAYAGALQQLATWAEQRQAWDEAITYMQRIVQLDALSEEAQRRLIELYVHTGAIGQALRQYRQFETELAQELGLTPSSETQALLATILETRGSATSPIKTMIPATAPASASTRTPQALPFVGRDDVLKKLLTISQDAMAGQGVTILLQGEDGIGKSRLLDELAHTLPASSPSWIILQGSCSPFDDLRSYGPFLEAFQSAGPGDLTDLLTEPYNMDPDEQGRFLWRVLQALRLLARGAPVLLTIDDLQWANSSTLHLFGFLAMRLRNLPIMLVGTVQRAEAIPALQRLITLGRRHGDVHLVSLPPLTIEGVKDLISSLGIHRTSASTLAEWLYERTGGSPFILVEIVAQLQAEGILTPISNELHLDVGSWLRWRATCTLPETTHDLVAWRLANLSSNARYLLDVLAVANQPLPFALLSEFPGVQADQLVPAIEDLIASGLLVEVANTMFALPHNLLRETLLLPLSHLRRRTIHRQLTIILEACPALQKNFPLRQVALHAVRGEDVERARRYGLQVLNELALDRASMQTTAFLDFLHHLYDLLAPTASTEELLRLTHALGQVHQSLGQLEEAISWHRRNLELATNISDSSAQITAHYELGELALVANDHQAAVSAARAGLGIDIPPEHPQHMALIARGHRLLGAALAMEGSDLPAAEGHLQEAVAAHRLTPYISHKRGVASQLPQGGIAEREQLHKNVETWNPVWGTGNNAFQVTDNKSDLCATLFELGNIAAQRGELLQALELYEEAARTAEAAHVYYFLALAHNNFAYHSLLLGHLKAAQRALARGNKLAETYEMFGALLHLASTQGEIHLYLGEWAEAAEAFQHGLALAEDLGNLERQAGYRAGLALAARGQGNLASAITLLEEALTLVNERGYWHLSLRIQLWLAETLLTRGLPEAEAYLDAALATAQQQGRTLLLMQGSRLHARLLAANGDWPKANDLFAHALEQATGLDLPLEIARTQAAWGESLLRYASQPNNGRALLAQAREVFTEYDAVAELQALMDTTR